MSSTMESFPTDKTTSRVRSMWGRLLWKDAREVVPIWITLLLAAILCLVITFWMVSKDYAHIAPLYISGHTFIALISVITGVYLLSSEVENRTLHLLRNLPLPPKQIVWQKLLLGAVGVVALACFIAVFTQFLASGAQCKPLEQNSTYCFTLANVFLLPLLYLVVALLSSMVSRSHFYGVLIAGAICAVAMAVLEPSWLGARDSAQIENKWLWVALTVAGGVCALVFSATGWVEERVITKPSSKRWSTQRTQPQKASPKPFLGLLWQSFRQSRVLLACCFGLTIVGWIVIIVGVEHEFWYVNKPNKNELPMINIVLTLLWSLAVMAMFASSIFLDDKRQGNYLFFQQNRERSKWLWLSRLLPFWGMALLLTLLWNFCVYGAAGDIFDTRFYPTWISAREFELFNSIFTQATSQAFLVPLLGLLGIIGIGQYFSLFVRNPILSFVFTGIISVIFACLFYCIVFLNESIWTFVVPTIVAGYVATWWRSKSWLATAQQVGKYVMPLAIPVIVFAIVAAMFIHHRVTEFGDVEIASNNIVALAHGNMRGRLLAPETSRWLLTDIEFGTEDQRQQAATLYKEAIELWDGEFGDSGNHGIDRMPWSAKKTASYVADNKTAIAKINEASQIPVCAPFDSTADKNSWGRTWALMELGLVDSHHQIISGNLTAAKQSIDAYDRVCQRSSRPAVSRYETGYYGLLVAWADHPDQELATIKSAIAQLEGAESDIRPTKIVHAKGTVIDPDSPFGLAMARFYREFGGERTFMKLQYNLAGLQTGDPDGNLTGLKSNFDFFPWEYQRYLKVSQLRELQHFNFSLHNISSLPLHNDAHINREQLHDNLLKHRPQPHIPIDEERMGFWYFPLANDSIESITWRRYTLLRLGLAAYRIEHDEYPDDLSQLEPYYQHHLPLTTDGLMFRWIKSGLEADLVNDDFGGVKVGEEISAKKIADGDAPLLLPFSIDLAKPTPTPLIYKDDKLGIDIRRLMPNRSIYYVPNFDNFSFYKMSWAVGAED